MSNMDSGSAGSDKSRRRRLGKNSSTHPNSPGLNTPISCDGTASNNSGRPDLTGTESVCFLSDPQAVFQVTSSFDSRKKAIVESIGFGGILSLPCISFQNKEFSVWLLKRLNWCTRSLRIGDNFSVTLNPDHVGKITGLRHSGIDISDKYLQSASEKLSFINSKLGFLSCTSGILQAAEQYIQQDLPIELTKELVQNFKIAFVIFVMGRFLAPSAEHADGNFNFWGALQNASQISSYNWSSYVLSNLFDVARSPNWVLPHNRSVSYVGGCTLILEIFYLDNIDFGALNLSHQVLPRWNIFSNESLSAMIQADKRVPSFGSNRTVFGRTKLLREDNTCYIYGSHIPNVAAPTVFTPSPRALQYSIQRTAVDRGSTPEQSGSDTNVKCLGVSTQPYFLKYTPDLDNPLLDFSATIRKKYTAPLSLALAYYFSFQVDPKVLDDLKLHNAKCLQHLAKLHRSLANDIVNENLNIATKLIEHHSSFIPISTAQLNNENCPPRRRRFNELFSGTDSSTEGEDSSLPSKLPKNMQPSSGLSISTTSIDPVPVGVTFSGHMRTSSYPPDDIVARTEQMNPVSGGQSHNITPVVNQNPIITNHMSGGLASSFVDCSKKNVAVPFQNIHAADDFPLTKKNSIHVSYSSHQSTSLHANLPEKKPSSKPSVCYPRHISVSNTLAGPSLDKNYHKTACMKPVDTETPEATIKMSHFSPNVSPTTEIKLFSGAALGVRVLETINGIDLNSSSFEDEYESSFPSKKVVCLGPFSLSHWEMKFELPDIEENIYEGFYVWLSTASSNDLESNWIVHSYPRFIKTCGFDLKYQFVMNKPMTFDVFDLSIRRIKQLDSVLYPLDIHLKWRHFLETDFSLHSLGYDNPVENKAIREQFVGSDCDYELSRCRMFFVPVFVEGKWWSYGWDLKNEVVFIIDPSIGTELDGLVINKHSGTIKQLAEFLSSTTNALFAGWSPKFTECKPVVFRFCGMPYKMNDTGIMTLFCLINFDGNKLVVQPTELEINRFRSYFLYQLMQIKDNCGRIPSSYVEYVD